MFFFTLFPELFSTPSLVQQILYVLHNLYNLGGSTSEYMRDGRGKLKRTRSGNRNVATLVEKKMGFHGRNHDKLFSVLPFIL